MSKLLLTVLAASLCLAVKSQDDPDKTKAVPPPVDNLSSRLRFSAVYHNGEVLISWASGRTQPGDFFIIEKSMDSVHFETLTAIGASADSIYSINDNVTAEAAAYYRLRVTGSTGNQEWTGAVRAASDVPVNLKFYPNPVDKQLILRASHTLHIQIRDAYGTIWINREIPPGLQTINVSTLEKGTYILQATDKQTNKTISEQLVKG